MVGFINDHRDADGVEPICAVLPIAPSRYYELRARQRCPDRRPVRARWDEALGGHIRRVWRENREVYGVRKVWKQLRREGRPTARCTVARLMRQLGLQGVVRGRTFKTTTIPDAAALRPPDLVTRRFTASRPNQLWVADLTYVATWRGLRVRRVRDRRIRPPDRRLAGVDFAAQRSGARCVGAGALRSPDRGVGAAGASQRPRRAVELGQYLSIRYTERLAEASIEPSVGSTGDSYDNALAESVIGLYKTEEIHRRGPWKGVEDVEFATLEWVAWYNTSRLLEPIGYVSPNEFEQAYYGRQPAPAGLAALT